MGLGIGTLVVFAIVGLLPIRGLKGFGIRLVLTLLLAGLVYKMPGFWEAYWDATVPLKTPLGDSFDGGFVAIPAVLVGLICNIIMTVVFRKKNEE